VIDTNFNITIECTTGELVTATWNYSKDHANSNVWKIEHIDSPSNSWIVTLTRNEIRSEDLRIKYNITISTVPSNADTEGSWECSYCVQSCKQRLHDCLHSLRSGGLTMPYLHPWKKAHNYEKYGYLFSEILLERKGVWAYSEQTFNISCRKTNGKSKQELKFNMLCIIIILFMIFVYICFRSGYNYL
jgi:hypothetical protein